MLQTTMPSYSIELSDDDITVTAAARTMLASLMEEAGDEGTAIRLYVQGGGCGGMGYSMTYSETLFETDSVLNGGRFKLVVDPIALNFLRGCEIDYAAEGLNSSFVFKNAFSSTGGSGTCSGCGGGGH